RRPDTGGRRTRERKGIAPIVSAGTPVSRGLAMVVVSCRSAGGGGASPVACLAALSKLERCAVIPQLWRQGERIREHVDRAAAAAGVAGAIRCVGLGPRTVMTFTQDDGEPWWSLKSLFQQECVKRGILFTGAHNIALAHDDVAVKAAWE